MDNVIYLVKAKSKSNIKVAETPLQKALNSFQNRLGVSYAELSTSREAQKIARKNLDKETLRLRDKYFR